MGTVEIAKKPQKMMRVSGGALYTLFCISIKATNARMIVHNA